jgi:glycogen operon protein
VQAWTGSAYPLGATYDGAGTNFALFTSVAEAVDLCLVDEDGSEKPL